MKKRSLKLGKRMAFLCWLIGKMKLLAYSAKVRVAGRKLKAHVRDYIIRFRKRRMNRFELHISKFLTTFTNLDNLLVAGRITIFMVIRI